MANVVYYDRDIFAHNLKYLLAKNHERQSDLAKFLGVSKSTVSCYCSGEQMPRYDKLKMLSEHFNVPIASLIELKAPTQAEVLTHDARDMTAHITTELEALKSAAAGITPSPVELIMSSLNSDGQNEFIRYGNELCTLDKYKAGSRGRISYIKHYLVPAAAGYASPIEGEDFELIPRNSGTPQEADFCITVQGDSMEPYIADGSLAFIKRDAPLNEFDVGVFFVDGDVFCKQWCTDYTGTLHLLSANPSRRDANIIIPRDSGRVCVCFGKVILKRKLPRPEYFN